MELGLAGFLIARNLAYPWSLFFRGGEEGGGGSILENLLEIGIKLLEGDTNGWIRINGQKLKDRNGKKWKKME